MGLSSWPRWVVADIFDPRELQAHLFQRIGICGAPGVGRIRKDLELRLRPHFVG